MNKPKKPNQAVNRPPAATSHRNTPPTKATLALILAINMAVSACMDSKQGRTAVEECSPVRYCPEKITYSKGGPGEYFIQNYFTTYPFDDSGFLRVDANGVLHERCKPRTGDHECTEGENPELNHCFLPECEDADYAGDPLPHRKEGEPYRIRVIPDYPTDSDQIHDGFWHWHQNNYPIIFSNRPKCADPETPEEAKPVLDTAEELAFEGTYNTCDPIQSAKIEGFTPFTDNVPTCQPGENPIVVSPSINTLCGGTNNDVSEVRNIINDFLNRWNFSGTDGYSPYIPEETACSPIDHPDGEGPRRMNWQIKCDPVPPCAEGQRPKKAHIPINVHVNNVDVKLVYDGPDCDLIADPDPDNTNK